MRLIPFDPFDPAGPLSDPKLVFETFVGCLKEGDAEAAREVLAGGLRHMNKAGIARVHGIPRRTIYNFLRKDACPSLDLVAKVCEVICVEAAKRGRAARRASRPSARR